MDNQGRVKQQDILPNAVHQRNIFEGWIIFSGLAVDRPDGTTEVQAYFATDSGVLSLWDGDSWVTYDNLFAGWVIYDGLAADRPNGSTIVQAYFATDTGVLSLWNGSTWINFATQTAITTSGTYTPTRSAEVNMDSNVTMSEAQYMRLGATVTVSGRFTADPTLTTTTTSFEMTLPVASNIGAAEDAAGVAFCGSIVGMGAEVIGVAANDTAKVQWKSSDITSQTWSYTYTYQVI